MLSGTLPRSGELAALDVAPPCDDLDRRETHDPAVVELLAGEHAFVERPLRRGRATAERQATKTVPIARRRLIVV
jgi:hypothetical protein